MVVKKGGIRKVTNFGIGGVIHTSKVVGICSRVFSHDARGGVDPKSSILELSRVH